MSFSTRTYAFPKRQRLSLKKATDSLFSSGKAFVSYPLRVVYSVNKAGTASEALPVILVSVSKKRFKEAVRRNRIKRLIREAFRLNSIELRDSCRLQNAAVHVAFLFIGSEIPSYDSVQKAMVKALSQVAAVVVQSGTVLIESHADETTVD